MRHQGIENIKGSLFYQTFDALCRNRFTAIRAGIELKYQNILATNKFKSPLPLITAFERKIWGGNVQWCLELDFENYEWSEKTIKPHFFIAMVHVEFYSEFIVYKFQFCTSFNESLPPGDLQRIPIDQLDDSSFVSQKSKELESFFEDLPVRFVKELENIDFDSLEFCEDG